MLTAISMRFFGGIIEPHMRMFDSLDNNLKRGMVKYSSQEYISILLFLSMLAFIITILAGAIFISFLFSAVSGSVIFNYTMTIIVAVGISGGVFGVGYYYPIGRANSVKSKIDRSLPFAVFFMATAASSGIQPIEVFKTMSQKRGVLGEVANKIYSSVKTLGMNLTDAMAKVANKSPSPSFADLLWGMISILTTGGDLEEYLNTKTRTFMTQYKFMLADYAKRVALYTEIYITLVMVGSLFFIVLTAIMSPIGGMNILMMQTFVVFFVIPMVSIGFIVILKGGSPME